MEERKNWIADIALENLTQEQVNELIDTMIAKLEEMGGFMGGGFSPAQEEDEDWKDAETTTR